MSDQGVPRGLDTEQPIFSDQSEKATQSSPVSSDSKKGVNLDKHLDNPLNIMGGDSILPIGQNKTNTPEKQQTEQKINFVEIDENKKLDFPAENNINTDETNETESNTNLNTSNFTQRTPNTHTNENNIIESTTKSSQFNPHAQEFIPKTAPKTNFGGSFNTQPSLKIQPVSKPQYPKANYTKGQAVQQTAHPFSTTITNPQTSNNNSTPNFLNSTHTVNQTTISNNSTSLNLGVNTTTQVNKPNTHTHFSPNSAISPTTNTTNTSSHLPNNTLSNNLTHLNNNNTPQNTHNHDLFHNNTSYMDIPYNNTTNHSIFTHNNNPPNTYQTNPSYSPTPQTNNTNHTHVYTHTNYPINPTHLANHSPPINPPPLSNPTNQSPINNNTHNNYRAEQLPIQPRSTHTFDNKLISLLRNNNNEQIHGKGISNELVEKLIQHGEENNEIIVDYARYLHTQNLAKENNNTNNNTHTHTHTHMLSNPRLKDNNKIISSDENIPKNNEQIINNTINSPTHSNLTISHTPPDQMCNTHPECVNNNVCKDNLWPHTWEKNDFPISEGFTVIECNKNLYSLGNRNAIGLPCEVYIYDPDNQSHWLKINTQGVAPIMKPNVYVISTNNKIYVFGGRMGDIMDFFNIWELKINTHKWTNITFQQNTDLMPARQDYTINIINNTLYVFGGIFSTKYQDVVFLNDLWCVNLDEANWQKLSEYTHIEQDKKNTHTTHNLPRGRAGHTSVTYNQNIYIFGGTNKNIEFGDFYEFDTHNKIWNNIVATGSTPSARYGHSANVCGDRMIIFAGFGGADTFLSDLYEYNFLKMSWTQIIPQGRISPNPRFRHIATFLDGFLYIFGGKGSVHINSNNEENNSNIAAFIDSYKINLNTPETSNTHTPTENETQNINSGRPSTPPPPPPPHSPPTSHSSFYPNPAITQSTDRRLVTHTPPTHTPPTHTPPTNTPHTPDNQYNNMSAWLQDLFTFILFLNKDIAKRDNRIKQLTESLDRSNNNIEELKKSIQKWIITYRDLSMKYVATCDENERLTKYIEEKEFENNTKKMNTSTHTHTHTQQQQQQQQISFQNYDNFKQAINNNNSYNPYTRGGKTLSTNQWSSYFVDPHPSYTHTHTSKNKQNTTNNYNVLSNTTQLSGVTSSGGIGNTHTQTSTHTYNNNDTLSATLNQIDTPLLSDFTPEQLHQFSMLLANKQNYYNTNNTNKTQPPPPPSDYNDNTHTPPPGWNIDHNKDLPINLATHAQLLKNLQNNQNKQKKPNITHTQNSFPNYMKPNNFYMKNLHTPIDSTIQTNTHTSPDTPHTNDTNNSFTHTQDKYHPWNSRLHPTEFQQRHNKDNKTDNINNTHTINLNNEFLKNNTLTNNLNYLFKSPNSPVNTDTHTHDDHTIQDSYTLNYNIKKSPELSSYRSIADKFQNSTPGYSSSNSIFLENKHTQFHTSSPSSTPPPPTTNTNINIDSLGTGGSNFSSNFVHKMNMNLRGNTNNNTNNYTSENIPNNTSYLELLRNNKLEVFDRTIRNEQVDDSDHEIPDWAT